MTEVGGSVTNLTMAWVGFKEIKKNILGRGERIWPLRIDSNKGFKRTSLGSMKAQVFARSQKQMLLAYCNSKGVKKADFVKKG